MDKVVTNNKCFDTGHKISQCPYVTYMNTYMICLYVHFNGVAIDLLVNDHLILHFVFGHHGLLSVNNQTYPHKFRCIQTLLGVMYTSW